MASKSTDLTILLKAVDKTKKAFDSVESRLGKLGKIANAVINNIAKIGAGLTGVFAAAAVNGREINTELNTMSRLLGIGVREADALFEVINDYDPTATFDRVTESLLTLQEGFFDARVESGPLFDVIKDFGANLNLYLESPKGQLIGFLQLLRQLPTETDRVGAAIANLGADDAKPFIALSRDVGMLDEAILKLQGSINDIPNVVSEQDSTGLQEYTTSVNELSIAWDIFSKETFALLAPALASINALLQKGIELATGAVRSVRAYQESVKRIFGQGIADDPVELVDGFGERMAVHQDRIAKEQAAIKAATKTAPTGLVNNEYGTFESVAAFDKWFAAQEKAITKSMQNTRIIENAERIRGFDSGSSGTRFLAELDGLAAGNDSRFNIGEIGSGDDARAAQRQAEIDQINGITNALGIAGDATGAFAQLAEANGSKSFKTFQKLQIAISTAAGISAQIQALASVDNPTFAQKLAAFVKIGALVASGIASLKSINVGSSSAPNSAGVSGAATGPIGGTAPAINSQASSRGNVTVNIQGNGDVSADQVEALIDAINDNDTGTRINLNRIAA